MIRNIKIRHILVAGGAGFIGSNLCKVLVNSGCKVTCIDNLSTGCLENIKELKDNSHFNFIQFDIKDEHATAHLVPIDLIINMACVASPKAYYKEPIDTLMTSVVGTRNLLELARKLDVPMLQTSTSEIYGDPALDILPESYSGNVSCTGPRACYDEGKRAAECLCMDYFRKYGVKVKIVRIFNTYGPNMACGDGRAIPEFINRALSGKNIIIYGKGSQTRSFQYIDDTIKGLVAMLNSDEIIGRPINIGNPNEECSVRDLAQLIIDLLKSKSAIQYSDALVDDPKKRKPDITLAEQLLDWHPQTSLVDGLVKTIEYFKNK